MIVEHIHFYYTLFFMQNNNTPNYILMHTKQRQDMIDEMIQTMGNIYIVDDNQNLYYRAALIIFTEQIGIEDIIPVRK